MRSRAVSIGWLELGMLTPTPHNSEVRIIPAKRDAAQRPLAQVIVDGQIPLLQVALQRFPVVQGVADGLTEHRLGQRLALLLIQPLLQLGQHRLRLPLPPPPALLLPLSPLLGRSGVVRGRQQRRQLTLDGVQRANPC
jgi:hypothetical protein